MSTTMTTSALMPMETLFEQGPSEFLRKHSPSADDLVAYMHIPKAAGNAVIGAIKESLPSVYHVAWNNIDKSFDEMIASFETQRYQLVSGHFRYNQIAKLERDRIPHINISMIRDPIDRVVSQYRYMCTPTHPNYKEFKSRFPTFEDFALSGLNDNTLANCLTGNARSAQDAFAKIVRTFHFVGLTEYMNESNYLIQRLLGCTIITPDRLNVTQKKSYNKVDISDELRDKLNEIHSVDVELYRLIRARFETIVDDIANLMAETKRQPIETRPTRIATHARSPKDVRPEDDVDFHPMDRYLAQFDRRTILKDHADTLEWNNPIVVESVRELMSAVLNDLAGSTTPTALWKSGIEPELVFWWRWVALTMGNAQRSSFLQRVEHGTPFQFDSILPDSAPDEIDVLDIGCGVTPDVGNIGGERTIRLHALDPLGGAYTRILGLFGLEPHFRLNAGMAEDISEIFPQKRFDFIHAKNCLDHAASPEKALNEIAMALKPGGVALLIHWENEGEFHQYKNFHQWNLSVNEEHQLVLWRHDDRRPLSFDHLGVRTSIRVFESQKRNGSTRRMIEVTLAKDTASTTM